MKIRRMSHALGAEIIGLDIREPLNDETFRRVHNALLEYQVLLFRGQRLTREQYVAFSRRFGEPEKDGTRRRADPKFPEISGVVNKPTMGENPVDDHYAGSDWHSDRSFRLTPTSIILLHGLEVPEVGGDTQFANMYLAYETLSDGMKKLIEGLEGVHMQEEELLDHSTPERLAESKRLSTVAQPLVRMHAETGRKSLYVGDKVKLLAGMTPEESEPLIRLLCSHATRPQFIYRHRWQKDDLVMWDNRCTNHNAVGDYDRQHQLRHLEKISIIGICSGYFYDA